MVNNRYLGGLDVGRRSALLAGGFLQQCQLP